MIGRIILRGHYLDIIHEQPFRVLHPELLVVIELPWTLSVEPQQRKQSRGLGQALTGFWLVLSTSALSVGT